MKILMLTPYLPFPLLSGGQIRTYNLLRKLATKHEITLFSLIKDYQEQQYIPEILQYCHQVKVFKRSQAPFTWQNICKTGFSSYPFLVIRNYVPSAVAAIKEELAREKYDLIHAETFYMMPHLPRTTIPTILAEQTIEYLGYESYASKTFWPLRPILKIDIEKIKRWEKHYWQKTDRLIVMSEEDQRFISQFVSRPTKIEVVSNGVDSQWFDQKKRQLPSQPTILYVGTFKWLPNIEAANFLIKQIWPLIKEKIPQAKLRIVGNAPTPTILAYQDKDPSIEISGHVDDIRDAFKQAHVLLAPVFSGKGTRYKILEAMASGTPVVATSTAVEGLQVKNNQQALISDDAPSLAQLTSDVINNPKLWHQLASNGHQFVKKNYDWELISQKLDQIYQSLPKT